MEGRTAACQDHGVCQYPGSVPGGNDDITQQRRPNEAVEVHDQLVHPTAEGTSSCDA